MSAALPIAAEGIAIVASHSRRLHRRMIAWQTAALRRARLGRHFGASERWKLLLRAHVVRQGILRKWGLL